ncbi:conserved hypothetical protein [Ricinus communis]|uniref:DUF1315 domain-containing protein n=1 Tax=Ricinus communis TaxID=3988 RepID=B9TJY5_RICCO|nr:conserved hypothetical protein [Ricinus communis]
MDYQQLIANITPDVHASLKRAVEIGRWPDGRRLTDEQRALCMEAVIAYEAAHVGETDRVGYIDRGSKAEGEVCGDDDHDHADHHEPQPLQWK